MFKRGIFTYHFRNMMFQIIIDKKCFIIVVYVCVVSGAFVHNLLLIQTVIFISGVLQIAFRQNNYAVTMMNKCNELN